jgi:hypothetical protein
MQTFKVVQPESLAGDDDATATNDAAATTDQKSPTFTSDDAPATTTSGDFPDGQTAPAPDIKLDLVKNRYYNDKYEPIADLPTLMSSVTVAKRVPVRIRLLMDQRQIAKLLVECANAPLTFEVRQLRFNPQGVGPAGALGEAFREPEGGLFTRQQAVKTLEDYQTLDRTVELFGIIYIFNPVDEAVLGGEKTAEEVPADDTAGSRPAGQRLAG